MTSRLTRIKVKPDDTVTTRRTRRPSCSGSIGDGAVPAARQHSRLHPVRQRLALDRHGALGRRTARCGSAPATRRTSTRSTRWRCARYDEQSLCRARSCTSTATATACPATRSARRDTNLTHVCTKLYAKGFRNPFRFHLRPGGAPGVGDVGWDTTEEIDLIAAGPQLRLALLRGPGHTPGYTDLAELRARSTRSSSPRRHRAGLLLRARSGAGGAIIGGPEYTGGRYPAGYGGNTSFFGDYVQAASSAYDSTRRQGHERARRRATTGRRRTSRSRPSGDLVYVASATASTGRRPHRADRLHAGNAPAAAVATRRRPSGAAPLQRRLQRRRLERPRRRPAHLRLGLRRRRRTRPARPSRTPTRGRAYTAHADRQRRARGSSADSVRVAVDVRRRWRDRAPADGSLFRHGTSVHAARIGAPTPTTAT